MSVPVTLTNTTDKAATVSAVISVEGPMKVLGGNSQSVNLNAKSEGRASFRIVADPTINVGKVTVTVNGMGEKFTEATEIAVRPPSTLQKLNGSGSITGGNTQK